MSTYTQIIYQIVFSTKDRIPCMSKDTREEVYKYIVGILKNKKCHPFQINGVEDHIHILTKIHPTIAPAFLIKDIKINSNGVIKNKKLFPDFPGWQDGYGAFTYSNNALPNLIQYVQNQERHHKTISFKEELMALLAEHGIEYDEKYLF
ncbi:MAG: transposase [Saprospiraceae bacterium]